MPAVAEIRLRRQQNNRTFDYNFPTERNNADGRSS